MEVSVLSGFRDLVDFMEKVNSERAMKFDLFTRV